MSLYNDSFDYTIPSRKVRDDFRLPFFARVEKSKEIKPGCWHYLDIGIYHDSVPPSSGWEPNVPVRVGGYERNYSDLLKTFYPFQGVDGKWYALYSRDYTSTRIMSLPDCKDIGGEDPGQFGFCPADYYVPKVYGHDYPPGCDWDKSKGDYQEWAAKYPFGYKFAPFGFVHGCIWGGPYEIQFIDLSRAHEGILTMENRFPDHRPTSQDLSDMVDVIERASLSLSDPDLFTTVQFDIGGVISYDFSGKKIEY